MQTRPDPIKAIQILIICGVVFLLCQNSKADEPQTAVSVASAIIYPTLFDGKAMPPTVIHSIATFVPVSYRWNIVLKGAMATPTTVFQPAPQIQAGAAARIIDRLTLGATGLYRYIPQRSGMTSDSHLVGVVLGPSIPLPSKIALGFSTGVTRNLTTKANSFFFGFELAFLLPI
jgi:hypothetical protein